jgi:hypothetical protein
MKHIVKLAALIVLLSGLIIVAVQPNLKVGSVYKTDYFSGRIVSVKITEVKYVGKQSQSGYLIWAKSLDGKDSLVKIDSYWLLKSRK